VAVFTPPGSGNAGEVSHDRPPSHSMLRSGLSSITLSALGLVLGFVSVPVMVAGLGYAGYGVYSIAFTIASYGAFLDLGFGWAGMKFAADAHAQRDREAVAGVLWALVLYQALVGAVVVVLLTALADPVGQWLMAGPGDDAVRVAEVLPTAGLWFALSSLNGVFVGVLRGVQRHAAAAVVAGTALVIGVGIGALVVAWGHGLNAAARCQVLGALAAAVGGGGALRGFLLPAPRGRLISASARALRRMLTFSLWTLLGRLVQVAVLQGDKVVAARAAGAIGLPSYVVPFNVAQRLNVLGSAAVTAVYPVAASRRQSGQDFHESYFRAARAVHLCTAAPAITLLVLAPLFLHSWIGPEMATSGAGFLRVLGLGYWIVSVASVEAGCLEGWGLPRLTALAATGGLAVAGSVAALLALIAGGLWAVAGGVAAWMTVTGLFTAIAWYRVSGFPAGRLCHELLRPIGEMVVLGTVVGAVAGGWLVPGPSGLLACGALVALLFVYGFFRIFPGGERRLLLSRVAALAGA
jgi:O-antigen/teichoic acid export membrane protein